MVSSHLLKQHDNNLEAWLVRHATLFSAEEYAQLQAVIQHLTSMQQGQQTELALSYLEQSLAIMDIIVQFSPNSSTLLAVLLMYFVKSDDIALDDIQASYGKDLAALIEKINKISTLDLLSRNTKQSNIDNWRKMLFAIVEDIRVLFIQLAEQVFRLRHASAFPIELRKKLAILTFDIYAPLANRLGLGQLKWELEDLAFRYADPLSYKAIAKNLAATRLEREAYVLQMKATLTAVLENVGIKKFEIYGRAKHIYSIYKKMQRKAVAYEQIYDTIALRVLVPEITDCYEVLSAIHQQWEPISEEFDDYISKPKANGYQSIHTAIVGPDQRNVEVQIRTFDMHEKSESGVAAHWKYKEGAAKPQFEDKVQWLRQLVAWQQELPGQDETQVNIKQLFSDRVYVFTPQGDIFDLPQGSTPLDFAYSVHTQLGHRCKGAKINDHIATLTTVLKTGDTVQLLTHKTPNPSRDWLNMQAGYLYTSKARSKVLHWFKQQDHEQYVLLGKQLLEKELKQLKYDKLSADELLLLTQTYQFKALPTFYAAIGNLDLKLISVIRVIKQLRQEKAVSAMTEMPSDFSTTTDVKEKNIDSAASLGDIRHVLSHTAKCCYPLPGDPIVGFVTRGHGMKIHKKSCLNILSKSTEERLIPMQWDARTVDKSYPTALLIKAQDRDGLLKDITTCLINEKIKLLGVNSFTEKTTQIAHFIVKVELNTLKDYEILSKKLAALPNVFSVERKQA